MIKQRNNVFPVYCINSHCGCLQPNRTVELERQIHAFLFRAITVPNSVRSNNAFQLNIPSATMEHCISCSNHLWLAKDNCYNGVRISGGNPYSAYRCLCFRLHENVPTQRVNCFANMHIHRHTHVLLSTSRFSLFHNWFLVQICQHKQPNFDFENGNFPLFLFVSTFAYLPIFHIRRCFGCLHSVWSKISALLLNTHFSSVCALQ